MQGRVEVFGRSRSSKALLLQFGLLEHSLGLSERSRSALGSSRGALGALSGSPGTLRERSWELPEHPRTPPGVLLGALGVALELSWVPLDRPEGVRSSVFLGFPWFSLVFPGFCGFGLSGSNCYRFASPADPFQMFRDSMEVRWILDIVSQSVDVSYTSGD